uniref:Uncharacterized protein n=1 Tax=Rhizophora mucronata TaxID=61149 RepID=A0A2P2QEV1_RHIMU
MNYNSTKKQNHRNYRPRSIYLRK